jgi:integrase/recombinase XerD
MTIHPSHRPVSALRTRMIDDMRAGYQPEDAQRLHPPRARVRGFHRPVSRYSRDGGSAPLPAPPEATGVRPLSINSAVAALRFFFS